MLKFNKKRMTIIQKKMVGKRVEFSKLERLTKNLINCNEKCGSKKSTWNIYVKCWNLMKKVRICIKEMMIKFMIIFLEVTNIDIN